MAWIGHVWKHEFMEKAWAGARHRRDKMRPQLNASAASRARIAKEAWQSGKWLHDVLARSCPQSNHNDTSARSASTQRAHSSHCPALQLHLDAARMRDAASENAGDNAESDGAAALVVLFDDDDRGSRLHAAAVARRPAAAAVGVACTASMT